MRILVTGAGSGIGAAAAQMLSDRGHEVVATARRHETLAGISCGTKHALEALSESLAFEVGHFGVRLVIIEPGYIAPGMKGAQTHPEAGTPYQELREQRSGADATLVGPGGRPGPKLVGEAIATAIADPSTPLRVPVGADTELVLATRKSLDDAEFETAMRELLGITW